MKIPVCLTFLISFVSADKLLFTVIYGNNVPTAVRDEVIRDEGSLLAVMDSSTPSSYSVCPSGDATVRKLFPIERKLGSCPAGCSNSGSTMCRALGCAYCGGRCRRQLRGLLTQSNFIPEDTATSISTSIKTSLDSDLAAYCSGIAGCELWTKVYVVHEDGSLTDASW
jgi:hypothetical protein